jgi:NADH-quinone oxidoreductase subunit J
MWEALFFWGFGGLAAVLAVLVITMKNPIHSALALIGNMFCLAALFALLDAHFLAAIQVLVYAGAIMVLFMFVIMLLNLKTQELGRARRTLAKGLGLVLLAFVAIRFLAEFKGEALALPPVTGEYGTLESIGRLIFGPQILPFEVASVLLLAAIMGAVAIAKKRLW